MAALYKLCGTVNASSSGLKKLGESNLCMNQVDQMEPKNDGKFHSYDGWFNTPKIEAYFDFQGIL